MIGGLLDGARQLPAGLGFLARRPRLWGWVAAPALATLLILIGVGWLGLALIDTGVAWVVSPLPGFLEGWVAGFLDVLFVALVAVAGYFVFFSLAAVVAAPFNEMLSETVEEELTGEPGPRFSILVLIRDIFLGLAHAARRMAAYLFAVGFFFIAGLLVPVIGPAIATAGGAWLTARFAAYEAMDAVFARRGMAYRDKMGYLRRHRSRTTGLGAAMALLLLVPGLNLIALSSGAVGATLLCHRLEQAAEAQRAL